ncbi:class I SAM-dependent methyltransferase [Sphingomonas oryzagri]
MLRDLLDKMIKLGRLTVRIGGQKPFSVGGLPIEGADIDVAIQLSDRRTAVRLALDPEFQLGECYMDGTLRIERGTLADLMSVIGHNLNRRPRPTILARIRDTLGRSLSLTNSLARARHNVEHHYDLSESFYRLFLDDDLQYSCAYFENPDATLETAQEAKKAHIAAKLCLQAGQQVLDIGCGWGGLALMLARTANVHVTGITLSSEQLRVARARADAAGLSDRVRFELADYRTLGCTFDRIVSVGMFEHVGLAHFPAYFRAIERLLSEDGVALVHSIGRKDPGHTSDRWTRRYIFPGGYLPTVSQATAALERTGMWLSDLEVLRLHYSHTLRNWRERVEAKRARIEAMYDQRFFRMWSFYLASFEMAFRFNGLMVFQMQIARQLDTLPSTRGYMAEREKELLNQSIAVGEPPSPVARGEAPIDMRRAI